MGGNRSQQAGQTRVTTGTAARRSRMTAPAVAAWSLGVLIILLLVADTPLANATQWAGNGYGVNLAAFIAVLPVVLVGFVVARR